MNDIELELIDALTDKPHQFLVEKKKFALYPKTLGKMRILQPVYDSLGVNEENVKLDPHLEAIRLCHDKRDSVCLVISYNTFRRKNEILDDMKVQERAKFFNEHLSVEDLALLLVLVLTDDRTSVFLNYLGIEKDLELKRKIAKIKKDTNCVSIGGSSIYGALVDFACNRYGWSLDYVLWEISYTNLYLLYSDQPMTINLSIDERKELHIFNDEDVINGDDPRNADKIREIFSD